MGDAVFIDLPLEAGTPREARERLEPFRRGLDETTYFDLRLLISELIVEALGVESRAQAAHIELRVERRDDRVHAEISEGSEAYRLSGGRPEPGEPGWALYLLRRLSSRWGVRRERDRSTVWLEMP
ncbi:MAG TPA: ATP-binding protein [Actinomycetota bacterium]|jgi:hypothetical protein|nr:ATP-binding protein [Actinomycetota bacterium]